MLNWLRKQAKPFVLLSLTGLLGQSLMLCCLDMANASTGNSTHVSHCHPQHDAGKVEEPPLSDVADSNGQHCPPTEKKACCDNDTQSTFRDDVAFRGLAQTVDIDLKPVPLPASVLVQGGFAQPLFSWLGSPPTLASPDIFLVHCAFLE